MHPESPTLLWKRSRGATAVAQCRSHGARAGKHRKASLEPSGQVRCAKPTSLISHQACCARSRPGIGSQLWDAQTQQSTQKHLVTFANSTCSKGGKASTVEHAAHSCNDSRSSQLGDRRCSSGFGQAFDRQSSVKHECGRTNPHELGASLLQENKNPLCSADAHAAHASRPRAAAARIVAQVCAI